MSASPPIPTVVLRCGKFRHVPISGSRPDIFSLCSSRMKLVFLHGSPAVGKLTVAKALLRMVLGRLFDNHAAVDLARTVFDFGAPGF
jgi:hypothetical protein